MSTSSSSAFRIRSGASLPATAAVGDIFFKTTATVGAYQALTANTWTAIGGGGTAADITVGTTTVTGGTTTRVLFDNAGVLGEYVITGTGNVVMSASPTLTGTVGAASLTLSSLTSGRVAIIGASGLLADDADFTFATDTLTVTKLGATTLTGTIAGGGQQLNNIIIGTTTPLAGSFTTLAASGVITQTSASATAFESGPNGGTNPVLRLVNSTASQADGVSITGLAAGSGVTFTALSSGSNAPINFTSKGTGNFVFTTGGILAPDFGPGTAMAFGFVSAQNTGIWNNGGTMTFRQSGTDRMTVGAGVNVTSTFANTGITADTAHTDTTVCQDTTTHQFYSGTGTVGICLGTSTLAAKENIVPLNSGLDELMRLKPISFNYRKGWGYPVDKTYYGFGAEDVRPILPNLAGVNAKGEPLNVDLLGMVPLLIRAMQEQQALIESQAAAIRMLDARIH